jgi:hypothetical protein
MRIQRVAAIVLVGMVAGSLSQGAARVADAAIVAHWALDDGQADLNTLTATDSVSPAADGAWEQGSVAGETFPRWASGIIGGAADFGGPSGANPGGGTAGPGTGDVISILTTEESPGAKLNITGALTMAAWVRYEEKDGFYSTRHIAGKDRASGATSDAYSIKHNMASQADTIQFMIDAPSGGLVTGNVNLSSSMSLTAYTTASQNNGWVHVAGVFQPDEFMRLYIDGVLDAERTTDLPAAIDTALNTPFNIGRLHNSNTHSFNGRIDDVWVYDHALTTAEILELATVPDPGGLLGDYNDDLVVDAADYVLWRKTGVDGQQGYEDWRASFGQTSPATATSQLAAVPEPSTAGLVMLSLVGLTIRRTWSRGLQR